MWFAQEHSIPYVRSEIRCVVPHFSLSLHLGLPRAYGVKEPCSEAMSIRKQLPLFIWSQHQTFLRPDPAPPRRLHQTTITSPPAMLCYFRRHATDDSEGSHCDAAKSEALERGARRRNDDVRCARGVIEPRRSPCSICRCGTVCRRPRWGHGPYFRLFRIKK